MNDSTYDFISKFFFFFFPELEATTVDLDARVARLEEERERSIVVAPGTALLPQHPFPIVMMEDPIQGEASSVLRLAWRLERSPVDLEEFLFGSIFSKLVSKEDEPM